MTATISSPQQQHKSMDSEIHKLLQRSHVELTKLPSSPEVVQFHKKQSPLSRQQQQQQYSSLTEAGGRSISAIFQHVSKNLDEKMIDEIASSDQKHQHRKFSKKDLTIALDMMSIFYEEQQKQESQQKKEQLLEQQPSSIAAEVNAWKQKTRLLKQQHRKNRNRQKDSLFRKAHDFVLKQPNAGVVVLVASPTGSISTYTSIDPRQEKLSENAQTQQARLVQMMQIMWQLYAQTDLSTRHQQHVVDQTFQQQQQKTAAPEADAAINACTLSSKQKSSIVHIRSYSSNNHNTVEGIDNNERIPETESSSSPSSDAVDATSSSAPQPSKKRRRMSWKQQQQHQQLSSRIKDEEVIVRVDDIMSCLCNKCKQQPVIVEQFHLERDGAKVPSPLPSRQQQKASSAKKAPPLPPTKKKSVAVIPMYEEDEDGDDTMDDFVSSSSISSGNSQRTVISDDMRPLSDLIRRSSSDSSDSEFDDESGYDSSSSSDTGG